MKNEKVSQLAQELYWIKKRVTDYNYELSELKYKLYLKRQQLNGSDWWYGMYNYDMCEADIRYIKDQIQSIRLKLTKEDAKAKEYKSKMKIYNRPKYCV